MSQPRPRPARPPVTTLWRTPDGVRTRTRALAAAVVGLFAAVVLMLVAGQAQATGDKPLSIDRVQPGTMCEHTGEVQRWRDSEYACEHRGGDEHPRWHELCGKHCQPPCYHCGHCGGPPQCSTGPSSTPPVTASPSPTPSMSATPSPSVTPTPSASSSPSPSPSVSASPTPSPTITVSPTPSPTPSASTSPTPSASASPTPSVPPSGTPTLGPPPVDTAVPVPPGGGDDLPLTGRPVLSMLFTGVGLVLAGVLVWLVGSRRIRRPRTW